MSDIFSENEQQSQDLMSLQHLNIYTMCFPKSSIAHATLDNTHTFIKMATYLNNRLYLLKDNHFLEIIDTEHKIKIASSLKFDAVIQSDNKQLVIRFD